MGVRGQSLIYLLFGVPINVAQVAARTFRVVFNIAFIARAFSLVFDVALFYDLRRILVESIHISLPNVEIPKSAVTWVLGLYNTLDSFFSDIDLPYRWRQETSCGGAVKWMQLFAVLIFFGCIAVVMATDIMFVIGIRSHRLAQRTRSQVGKLIINALLDLATTVCFYFLQVFAFIGLQMLLDGASVNSTRDLVCSQTDADALTGARYMTVVALILFVIVGFVVYSKFSYTRAIFSNVRNKCVACFGFLVMMVKHSLCLTLGIWDPENLKCYEVLDKAATYDDDPDDDDSQQEAVINIIAKTRGLIWVMIPATVFLTKLGEAFNECVIFARLDFNDALWKRIILWILNVAEAAMSIAFVFAPDPILGVAILAELGFRFVFSLYCTLEMAVTIFKGLIEKINTKKSEAKKARLEKRKQEQADTDAAQDAKDTSNDPADATSSIPMQDLSSSPTQHRAALSSV
eukprot:TRINITY_DN6652_c1_g3_i2.p1 TRINITY_DN6652_c1_g3~~TRINITY_DN6652_c1_g3_i2.p1  ORF type:complete len:461 (+),score=120.71 TRINITY_DN6652_c1_g3_i2:1095-2477(+)